MRCIRRYCTAQKCAAFLMVWTFAITKLHGSEARYTIPQTARCAMLSLPWFFSIRKLNYHEVCFTISDKSNMCSLYVTAIFPYTYSPYRTLKLFSEVLGKSSKLSHPSTRSVYREQLNFLFDGRLVLVHPQMLFRIAKSWFLVLLFSRRETYCKQKSAHWRMIRYRKSYFNFRFFLIRNVLV